MNELEQVLRTITREFTSAIISALRVATIEDFMTATGGKPASTWKGRPPAPKGNAKFSGGRLTRRSPEQLEAGTNAVVAFISDAGAEGVTAEAIKKGLSLNVREVPKLLALALEAKRIRRRGVKRATRYFMK